MSGSRDASFTEFVRNFSPALTRVAHLLTGDHGHAEDLLQVALLKTSRRWWRLENPDKAYAYVRTVMINTHITSSRRRRVDEHLIDSPPEADWAPHDHFADPNPAAAALAALPPGMRAVVVLRFYEDLSERDTATALGCSVGNVKSQTSRALDRLRDAVTSPPNAPSLDRPPRGGHRER